MVFPLLGLIGAIAPHVISLFDSDSEDTAKKAVSVVSSVAQAITGQATDDAAAEMLRDNPETLVEFQRALTAPVLALQAEETKRLAEVNKTIRAEVASKDPFVRRMRPAWGYTMCATWGTQMMAISYNMVQNPEVVPAMITAAASLTGLWGIALGVLGVYIHGRSREKTGSAGLLETLISRFKKG